MTRLLTFNTLSNIIGAGGYGIVVLPDSRKKEVFKLFYDLSICDKIVNEVSIQQKAYLLFKKLLPEIGIPEITYFKKDIVDFEEQKYLCGIGMKYLEPPEGFDEAVHILLGYDNDDLDTSWGRQQSLIVSKTNPTRGFFASKETLQYIWNFEKSSMTIEKMAYLMGKAIRLLIHNNILPIDIEWIWSEGKPWIIDFGLCELGSVDPYEFLELGGSRGLRTDLYIPHKHDEGYDCFMSGFNLNISM
jgi:hypothetical protein